MRIVLVGLSAALLAGCNATPVVNNSAGNSLMPGNVAAPGAPAFPGAPGNGMAPPAISQAQRADMIGECTTELRRGAPAGANVEALCTCSVDGMAAGAPQEQAVRQCAQQQGIVLPQR